MNSRHAEMDVLRRINISYYRRNKIKMDLYVVRMTKEGEFAESKPCKHCIDMMINSGIHFKWIYYSTSDKIIVKKSFVDLIYNTNYVTRGNR